MPTSSLENLSKNFEQLHLPWKIIHVSKEEAESIKEVLVVNFSLLLKFHNRPDVIKIAASAAGFKRVICDLNPVGKIRKINWVKGDGESF